VQCREKVKLEFFFSAGNVFFERNRKRPLYSSHGPRVTEVTKLENFVSVRRLGIEALTILEVSSSPHTHEDYDTRPVFSTTRDTRTLGTFAFFVGDKQPQRVHGLHTPGVYID